MKRILFIFLCFLLFLDLGISFLQYFNVFIDGDLSAIVLPAEWYAKVLEDPTGIRTILSGQPIGGAGRYFAHLTMHEFYYHIPLWIQTFTDAISSVYLSSALFMLLAHCLVLWALSGLVSGQNNPFSKGNLILAAVATVFFQFNYNYSVMALIDRSPTYVFFYIWPMALLLFCYIPFYRLIFVSGYKGFNWKTIIVISLLYIYATFSSALAAPVCLIWNMIIGLILLANIRLVRESNDKYRRKSRFGNRPLGLIILFSVLSLYAYFLGRYNVENVSNNALMGLADRYILLLKGIKFMLTDTFGFSLLVTGLCLNLLILFWFFRDYINQYKWLYLSAFIFICIYLFLLPLGGYREYRPLIVRYDTFIPITLTILWLFLHSSWQLYNSALENIAYYRVLLLGFILVFFYTDMDIQPYAACEKEALKQIESSDQNVIILKERCRTLSWEPIDNPDQSVIPSKMLQVWGIAHSDLRFASPPAGN